MSGQLQIYDHSQFRRSAFLNLKEVLAVMPSRAAKSRWLISPFSDDGEELLDILTEGENPLEECANTGKRLSFAKLVEAAQEVNQVIWGRFSAYDGEGGEEPWIVLTAFDSSCWLVDTNDHKIRRRIQRAFSDVRVESA